MGCVVYLYLIGFWQAGGGANGRRMTTISVEMVVSTSADPANHCYINSTKRDSHPVHYSDPTGTRTYIPAPLHCLLCTYRPTSGHLPSIGSSISLPEPCQM